MSRVDLSSYDNSWYWPGRSKLVRALWFFIGLPIVRSSLLPSSSIRRIVLRSFGAKLERGVVLKPGIRVKSPWFLSIGKNSWIGEDVWIDNLVEVKIGANVCISQGAYLCTGNHDWSDISFGLNVRQIVLEDGSWVGARALLGPGVIIGACGIAVAGSIVTAVSLAVAGSIACMACAFCKRCVACLGCAGCTNCVGCVGCYNCSGLRFAVGLRDVHV